MRFNTHSDLVGLHAFLSASKYHWINYDNDKLMSTWDRHRDAVRGSELHDLAARLIRMKIKMPRTRQTFNMYVNDAIGYRMTPEQVLFYSPLCFGTADAIGFRKNPETGRMLLRIHDLKNGFTPAKIAQLKIYAAMFCLEYNYRPSEIDIELRLYQSDDVEYCVPEVDEIAHIMSRIVEFVEMIENARAEANND
mgnify:CR=1 FL=1